MRRTEQWYAKERKRAARWRANPKNKARRKRTAATWYAKPENKAKHKAEMAVWNAKPENIVKMVEWRAKPESRARKLANRLGARIEIPNRSTPDLCECCNEKPRTQHGLHFDHCHDTGRFRGWCCHHCNTGQTAAKGIRSAKLWLAYLERPWQSGPIKWAYPRKGRGSRAVAA